MCVPSVGRSVYLFLILNHDTRAQLDRFRAWLAETTDVMASDPPPGESRLRRHLRARAQPLVLPPGFPDARVADAFWRPAVDRSRESFTWGEPDGPALCAFAGEKVSLSLSIYLFAFMAQGWELEAGAFL